MLKSYLGILWPMGYIWLMTGPNPACGASCGSSWGGTGGGVGVEAASGVESGSREWGSGAAAVVTSGDWAAVALGVGAIVALKKSPSFSCKSSCVCYFRFYIFTLAYMFLNNSLLFFLFLFLFPLTFF